MAPRPSSLPTRYDVYLLAVIGLLEGVRRLSSPRLADLTVRALGRLAHRVSREKRTQMEQNLSRWLGSGLSAEERARIVRGSFRAFWDEAFGFISWRAARTPAPLVSGLEHLEAARRAGRGAILWETGKLGRRTLAKQILQRHGFRVHQVHNQNHIGGFRLEQQVEEGLPLVDADAEALTQALLNLINNAIKYSRDDKHIVVEARREGDSVRISVKDRGIGVAKSEHKKIFEKFYRAEDSLVHETKGSGLGLSLVKHIMDAHGGRVEVDSSPGRGSVFALVLPGRPAE